MLNFKDGRETRCSTENVWKMLSTALRRWKCRAWARKSTRPVRRSSANLRLGMCGSDIGSAQWVERRTTGKPQKKKLETCKCAKSDKTSKSAECRRCVFDASCLIILCFPEWSAVAVIADLSKNRYAVVDVVELSCVAFNNKFNDDSAYTKDDVNDLRNLCFVDLCNWLRVNMRFVCSIDVS